MLSEKDLLIKKKIQKLDDLIEAEVTKNLTDENYTFIQNPLFIKIKKEKTILQNECNHQFKNGICIICGKEEKINESN